MVIIDFMNNKLYRLSLLPFFAFFLSALFWIIDSIIDFFVFKESESLLDSFVSPEPMELWMRCIVVVMLFGFSFFARHLLRKEMIALKKLEKYKSELEETVGLRTQELELKNKELKEEIKLRKKIEDTLKKIADMKDENT